MNTRAPLPLSVCVCVWGGGHNSKTLVLHYIQERPVGLSFNLAHLLNIVSLAGCFLSLHWPADAFWCCVPIKLLSQEPLSWGLCWGNQTKVTGNPTVREQTGVLPMNM